MIIEIKETTYMGFLLQHVENKGWQIVLHDGVRILFPTMQDAQIACRQFRDTVQANGGNIIITKYAAK